MYLVFLFTQIKESEWLNGVDWPEPDHQYRSLPLRVPFESTELTEAEAKTRELIKDIGIGKRHALKKYDRFARNTTSIIT